MDKPQPERRSEPFAQIPTSVVRDPTLSVFAKVVYAVLASYANRETALCWPSLRTISHDASCSLQTAQNAISELETRSLIVKSRRFEQGTSEKASNIYELQGVLPHSTRVLPDSTPMLRDSTQVYRETAHGVLPRSTEQDLKNKNQMNKIGVPKKRSERDHGYSPEFENFWNSYPRREGKRSALKQWNARLKAGATSDEMIAGAQAYAAKVKGDGRETKFVKLAATFLGPDEHFREAVEAETRPVETIQWAKPELFVEEASK